MELETNVEFVTRIMEFSPYGAFSQLVIIEAIGAYVDRVADPNVVIAGNAMINPARWKACAEWIKAEMDRKYPRPKSTG